MTTPQIGDNSGPSLYLREIGKLQAIDAVLKNPRLNQTEALVLIGLIVRSNSSYSDAFPGGATLALYAKVKRTDTVFAALRRLEDHFEMIDRKSRGHGRSNSYTVMPQKVVDAIVEEFEARKAAATQATHPLEPGDPENEPTRLERVTPEETHPVQPGEFAKQPTRFDRASSTGHPVEPGATHPVQPGTYPFHIHSKKEGGEQARPPAQKNEFVPVNWTTALNSYASEDANDVFWVDGCRIEVINGFKLELQRDFPNVDIISGLSIVAGEAKPHVVGTDLKARIRRKFGYLNNEERNRDRRYTQRVNSPSTTKATKPSRW